jgi:hypothetical protein
VGDATIRLEALFTPARRFGKTTAVQFNESADPPNERRIDTVPTLQALISQSPTNVAPIKARACGALHAVLRSRRRQGSPDVRLMARGAERC